MVLPYLKGLVIIKCGFFYLALWIYCVFIIYGDYICRSIQVLNKWYQSTFLGRSCGQIFFIFADFFFFGEEKRGLRHSRHFQYIFVKNLQKMIVYLSSSQKNTQVEKKNHLKRSPEGQDIEVLKSVIFQGFSADGDAICFYFCSIWRLNLPK
jgi:hypothetical protein